MAANTQQDFAAKYTNANLSEDAASYDSEKFRQLLKNLETVDNGSIKPVASALLAAMLCAQRRGDIVPKLFQDLTAGQDNQYAEALFLSFKQAMTVIWPFVGLPNCIPSCLGLINELRGRGIQPTSELDRPDFQNEDWSVRGQETNDTIYRVVGNPEVGQMVAQYYPEISYVAKCAAFGFLVGGSGHIQSLALTEMILASAITAMGATRQARSHCKASMGLGNSPAVVQAMVDSALAIAAWNGTSLPGDIDVPALHEEVKANSAKLES